MAIVITLVSLQPGGGATSFPQGSLLPVGALNNQLRGPTPLLTLPFVAEKVSWPFPRLLLESGTPFTFL